MSNGMLIILAVVAIWFSLDGCDRWIYMLKKGFEGEYDETGP